ncbi:MAG: hypothetical protein ACREP6_06030, partial [Candidatus Binataceae bacterium]
MEAAQNQNFAPILILLAISVAFLYVHFTGGSGRIRLYLAALLVIVGGLVLAPSFTSRLPDWWANSFPTPKIQLGLDLQGGSHLLLEVKIDDAVKTALRRRGDDLKRELTANKIPFTKIDLAKSGNLVVQLKNDSDRSAFLDVANKA